MGERGEDEDDSFLIRDIERIIPPSFQSMD